MPQPVITPTLSAPDRLALSYQLQIHLLGISPQISRRVLVCGDTTLAELHHIVQVATGWENWHLHRFKHWGKAYGIPYASYQENVVAGRSQRLVNHGAGLGQLARFLGLGGEAGQRQG